MAHKPQGSKGGAGDRIPANENYAGRDKDTTQDMDLILQQREATKGSLNNSAKGPEQVSGSHGAEPASNKIAVLLIFAAAMAVIVAAVLLAARN